MAYGIKTYYPDGTTAFDSTVHRVQRLMYTVNTSNYPNRTVHLPNFDSAYGHYFFYPNVGTPPPWGSSPTYPVLSWNNSSKHMSWHWHENNGEPLLLGTQFFGDANIKQNVTIFCVQYGGDPPAGSYGFSCRNPDNKVVVDDASRTLAVVKKYENQYYQGLRVIRSVQGYTSRAPGYTAEYSQNQMDGWMRTYFDKDASFTACVNHGPSAQVGMTAESSGVPKLQGSLGGGNGHHTQYVIAPHTKTPTPSNSYGIRVQDPVGNVTFQSSISYAEVVASGAFKIQNGWHDRQGDTTFNFPGVNTGNYELALLYQSTCPYLGYVNVGAGPDGAQPVLMPCLYIVGNSQLKFEWRNMYTLPYPRHSTFYKKGTLNGYVEGRYAVLAIPKTWKQPA